MPLSVSYYMLGQTAVYFNKDDFRWGLWNNVPTTVNENMELKDGSSTREGAGRPALAM